MLQTPVTASHGVDAATTRTVRGQEPSSVGGASVLARGAMRSALTRRAAPEAMPTAAGVQAIIVTPDEFAGELLSLALQHRGVLTVARCASPSSAPTLVSREGDVLLRLVTLRDQSPDLAELHAARQVRVTVGLVLLTTALDLRLLGTDPATLPLGTRVLHAREPGALARLAAAVESAARHPAAAQRRSGRIPLTDEQVDALRAIAEGLNNNELAARRCTSVGAARALVNRTARSLGIRTDTGPSQVRAELGAAYVRLVGGADLLPNRHR